MQSTILARFFPPQDPIDQQLHQLQKQGAGMARIAHFCATLLVVLFSAGSFVALGSDALHSILVKWSATHQLDIPSAISLCVSTLMVLAMDVAMLSAAATLRLLASRRAEFGEMLLHIAVMAGVCILESGTYLDTFVVEPKLTKLMEACHLSLEEVLNIVYCATPAPITTAVVIAKTLETPLLHLIEY